jgi:hypothetical protein
MRQHLELGFKVPHILGTFRRFARQTEEDDEIHG